MPAVAPVVVRDESRVDGSGNSQIQRFNGRFSVSEKSRDITVAFRTTPSVHRIRAVTSPNNGCFDQYGTPKMALPETSSYRGDDARLATGLVDIHPLYGDISGSSGNDRGVLYSPYVATIGCWVPFDRPLRCHNSHISGLSLAVTSANRAKAAV